MESVTQEDSLGCAIACAAKVMGRDYKNTKKLFPKKTKGFLCIDLVKVLRKSGMNSHYCYIGNQKIKYKENDIVFIKRTSEYPQGHYFLRGRGQWMDSWINFKTNPAIRSAKSNYRKRLPGKAI